MDPRLPVRVARSVNWDYRRVFRLMGIDNKWASVSNYWLVTYQPAHPPLVRLEIRRLDGSSITAGGRPGETGEIRKRDEIITGDKKGEKGVRRRERMQTIFSSFLLFGTILRASRMRSSEHSLTSSLTSGCQENRPLPKTPTAAALAVSALIPASHTWLHHCEVPTLRCNVFMNMKHWYDFYKEQTEVCGQLSKKAFFRVNPLLLKKRCCS